MRSRTTRMNKRQAIPAKGTRFSAKMTAFLRVASESHAPASLGLEGISNRIMTRLVPSSSENAMPAVAAARGVLSALPALEALVVITYLHAMISRVASSPIVSTLGDTIGEGQCPIRFDIQAPGCDS